MMPRFTKRGGQSATPKATSAQDHASPKRLSVKPRALGLELLDRALLRAVVLTGRLASVGAGRALQHGRALASDQQRDHHQLSAWKFKRIVVHMGSSILIWRNRATFCATPPLLNRLKARPY